MRFYVLSDLHLKKDNELYAIEMIKKLCEKIRLSSKLDETILFSFWEILLIKGMLNRLI